MSGLPNRNLPLPQRVYRARKLRGLSQERFAEAAALTRRHVIRIENGDVKNLLPETAERMSAALDLPSDFFIDVSDEDEEEAALTPRDMAADLMVALDRYIDRKLARA